MRRPTTPLCVMLPEIGIASETFLRWEVEQLLPGRTAVVADPPPAGLSITGAPTWGLIGQPALVFTPIAGDPPPDHARQEAVAEFLDRHGVQVVLLEYLDFADRWFDLLRALGPRIWLRAHGADVAARLRTGGYAERYRRFATADGLILPSLAATGRLAELGIPRTLMHVVGHAVHVPARSRLHSAGTACVSVGRLVPKKGPLLTLEAFRLARRQIPQLTLDLVGDGPLADAVRRYVYQHDLHGCVRLHGQLDHRQALHLMRGSDLLLHHAITADDGDIEGQPLVILEAMAAGLAVITTRHAGIPEIISDDVIGRLVAERDVAAMASHIVDLARHPAHRARLGTAARHTIINGHTTRHARRHLQRLLGLVRAGARPS
jgi:colanic acid/amylovoran biosynthesis glycosyltransferase